MCALQLHVAKLTARTQAHNDRSIYSHMHAHAMQGWSLLFAEASTAQPMTTTVLTTHTDSEIISLYTNIHTPTLPSYLAMYVCVCS
jgi:hypothetical protein